MVSTQCSRFNKFAKKWHWKVRFWSRCNDTVHFIRLRIELVVRPILDTAPRFERAMSAVPGLPYFALEPIRGSGQAQVHVWQGRPVRSLLRKAL